MSESAAGAALTPRNIYRGECRTAIQEVCFRMRKLLVLSVTALALLFAGACATETEDVAEENVEAQEEVAEFRNDAQERLTQLEQRWNELSVSAQSTAGEANQALQQQMAQVQTEIQGVRQNLADLGAQAGVAWDQTKQNIETRLDQIESSLDQIDEQVEQ